ncbi:fascin-2 [Crotalus adamanteus]|uniref:Fascin-2 n=1 Tax=Crotalus adamanteus TaxID=8729 RepID=A0AAW1BZM3_CROAD
MFFLLGVNVSANQDEETHHETFQMQIDKETKKCIFHSNTGNYWTLVAHGGIQAMATEISTSTMFDLEWRGRRVALKANNGKYICTKKNGQLAAVSDRVGKDEEFVIKLINRPILVLRGAHGFVCYHRNSNLLDANRSIYDVFHLNFNDGAYQIKGLSDRFWYVASNGMVCSDGETSEDFFFEFRECSRVAIKGKNGKYLRGDSAGTLRADADTLNCATFWEY